MLSLARVRIIYFIIPFLAIYSTAYARYTPELCKNNPGEYCFVVHEGESWQSLWPDPQQRDLAMRLNRLDTPLHPGIQLVDPEQMTADEMNASIPFPPRIDSSGHKTIVVSPDNLSWAAYDTNGELVNWGPASTARGFCPDEDETCHTPTGTFTIFRKGGEECKSTKFPLPKGGAPMPYCMYFHGGIALHGSNEIPGVNASHGCVRILPKDARWLNQQFVDVGSTRVVIEPHESEESL